MVVSMLLKCGQGNCLDVADRANWGGKALLACVVGIFWSTELCLFLYVEKIKFRIFYINFGEIIVMP